MESIVLGNGPIGGLVARMLVERGDNVAVATRSGSCVEGARSIAVDAADTEAFATASAGADTIFNCANPPYARWVQDWPPLVESIVNAARRSGSSLVTMGNMYPYGRATMPMTEDSVEDPAEGKGAVRRDGWATARAAHEAGDIRAVEVRASDYFGAGAPALAHLGRGFFAPIMAGSTARVIGDPAAPHSWAYLPDIASTLVAAADYSGDWGRIWHVPSSTTASRLEILDELRASYGASGRVVAVPPWLQGMLARVSPNLREVAAVSYQFTAPFISNSDVTDGQLGVHATPWEAALSATVEDTQQTRRNITVR